jgi:hypothetical protein
VGFSKNGGGPICKPPEKMFWETEFDNFKKMKMKMKMKRDLVLEHALALLESKFAVLRDKKLRKQRQLTLQDKSLLCNFHSGIVYKNKSKAESFT